MKEALTQQLTFAPVQERDRQTQNRVAGSTTQDKRARALTHQHNTQQAANALVTMLSLIKTKSLLYHMLHAQLFLLPLELPRTEHTSNGNYGNHNVNH
jgi:hypothetical protein